FLDPVADKVLVAIAMVLVTEHYHSWWVTLPAATMIAREIIISSGLTVGRTRPVISYLASPGGTSERSSILVGEVDAMTAVGIHGL
ncbi:ADP-ribose diphosphatase, partial [Salmonella enterica subsp. enterica serovar Anatum]|nr:ADP-ribose diphosphatase [Salmonella enterica subsp. enterica serovar Anatum]